MGTQYVSDGNDDGCIFGGASDKISFFGATPVVKQTGAAAGTDAATTQTLANQIRTVLQNLGVMTTET